MDEDLKHNLTASETWLRGLFIVLFAFMLFIARVVTGAVVVIQFLFTVFAGQTNTNLKNFGASLARYVYQCLLFVTYNTDSKPFPFGEWPDAEAAKGEINHEAEAKTKSPPKPKAKAKTKTKPKAKPETTSESGSDVVSDKPGSTPED